MFGLSLLFAGATPIKPPNHWQFFGFNKPTNQHNLDSMYRQRLNELPLGGRNVDYGWSYYVNYKYLECCHDLDAAKKV
jgi:hypothetical protein